MFKLVTDEPTALEIEFHNYLHEPCPDNPEIKILKFWKSTAQNCPNLADVALQLLCLPNGSTDVERSFSKLRKLQDPTRSSMSEKTLPMQMTLYVNEDLELVSKVEYNERMTCVTSVCVCILKFF